MAKKKTETPKFEDEVLTASANDALAAVKQAGPRAESLVEAWTAAKNAAAVQEVAERGDGAARKAARRALNVLKARGVQIPELVRKGTLGGAASEEVVEAWMMAPDSAGMQVFAVGARSPAGRSRLAFVFLHGGQGVARVDNATMSQSQLKDYFAKLLPGSGYGPTKVPPEWARHRIAAARALHQQHRIPEPLGFTTAASLLEPVPAEPPPHPFDDEGLELSEDDAREMAKDSAKLHNLPEFRSWLPSSVALEEMMLAVGKRLTPGETPDPGSITLHLGEEALAATDRFFSPEIREEVVRRMKDSALSVLAREGEHLALEVSAAINVIQKCGLVTNPPRDVPFLKAYFDKAIAMMAAQGGGKLRIPVPARMGTPETPASDEGDPAPAGG